MTPAQQAYYLEERARALAVIMQTLHHIQAGIRHVAHLNQHHGFNLALPREAEIVDAISACVALHKTEEFHRTIAKGELP